VVLLIALAYLSWNFLTSTNTLETRSPTVFPTPILTLPRGCFDIRNSNGARASFDGFFDFGFRISPLSNNPRSPVSSFNSKCFLCTQSTLQTPNTLNLVHKRSSLLCFWSTPNRVYRFPCIASEFF